MGLNRTVDPANLAVAVCEAKARLNIPEFDSSQDGMLDGWIRSAIEQVERHTRRALINQTWKLTLREFPFNGRVYLPRPPLSSVTSIVYVNDSGSSVTLSPSLYQVATNSKPAYVEPAYAQTWPSVRPETAEAITITYVAGFGTTHKDVPDSFKNAIYELVAFRAMNRGDVETDFPRHIMLALDSLKCGAKYDYYGLKN